MRAKATVPSRREVGLPLEPSRQTLQERVGPGRCSGDGVEKSLSASDRVACFGPPGRGSERQRRVLMGRAKCSGSYRIRPLWPFQ